MDLRITFDQVGRQWSFCESERVPGTSRVRRRPEDRCWLLLQVGQGLPRSALWRASYQAAFRSGFEALVGMATKPRLAYVLPYPTADMVIASTTSLPTGGPMTDCQQKVSDSVFEDELGKGDAEK
jgi:hypothetical protein